MQGIVLQKIDKKEEEVNDNNEEIIPNPATQGAPGCS